MHADVATIVPLYGEKQLFPPLYTIYILNCKHACNAKCNLQHSRGLRMVKHSGDKIFWKMFEVKSWVVVKLQEKAVRINLKAFKKLFEKIMQSN